MEMKAQNRDFTGVIEVRLDNLQYLQIEDALGRINGLSIVRDSWYRIGLDHNKELTDGRSIILTFPARLGALPADYYGIKPEARAEWLPVIIRALQKVAGNYAFAEVLIGLYEAIAWGYAEELAEFDGLFDLATIAGRQRLLARRSSMEHMHNFSPELTDTPADTLTAIENGEVARYGY